MRDVADKVIPLKEVDDMEEKKEGSFPNWVWVIVLGLAAAVVVAVVLLLE